MKRGITLSIALALSVILVALMSSDQAANAQNQIRRVADTGVIKLGANQKLVMMIDADLDADIVFHEFIYETGTCMGGICKHVITSQARSNPIHLTSGEALSKNFPTTVEGEAVRGVVLSNNRDVRVNAYIINTVTGAFEADVLRDW